MFGIDPRSIPACHSFGAAEYIWATAKDCSSKDVWGSNARPLDSVRMRHKAITKHGDGSYSFDLYQTEMCRYYPNGDISGTTDGRISSVNFFHRVCPDSLYMMRAPNSSRACLLFNNDGAYVHVFPTHERFYLKSVDTARGAWRITTPTDQRTRTVADRKEIARIMKASKGFFDWVHATTTLTGRSPLEIFWRADLSSISLPIEPEMYPIVAQAGGTVEAVKRALNRRFGAYSTINIPNTEPIRRSKIGSWSDT
jgi:hypothetical protein